MQLTQKTTNTSHLNHKEITEYRCNHFSNENLESITKIALLTIPIAFASLYIYHRIKNFIHKISTAELPCLSKDEQTINVLQSIGIQLEEDLENPCTFVCANCGFVQIHEMIKLLPEKDKNRLGKFYYSPQKRTICYDPEKSYSIQYPEENEWPALIKASQNEQEKELPPLKLDNGALYFEKTFIEHPLFRNTLEKYSVFQRLCQLQEKTDFQQAYTRFLDKIQSNNVDWADEYLLNPTELAYLSLFAYLNEKITKEELFIIHMLASAFLESPESARYTVLSSENVRPYLKRYFFLTEENICKDFYSLKNLDRKSVILRTATSFQSAQAQERAAYTTITKRGGTNPPGVKLLPSSERKPPVDLALLPPWLWKRFYAELFPSQSPPIEHEEFFGFRRRLDDLILGRPISYASPLFYLPAVHTLKGTQLGVTAHDILYHSYLDWIHPDAHNFITLGQKVRTLGKEKEILDLAMNLLDRPMISISSDRDKNIVDWLTAYASLIQKLSKENQKKFFAFTLEIFGQKITDKFFSIDAIRQKFAL